MEVPEVTEFDVYLDIDGAVEEDEEDTVQSENEAQHVLPLERGEQSVQLPWQTYVGGPESGKRTDKTASSGTPTRVSGPSRSGQSAFNHESDTEEVDVDTPYDGKLLGQTHVKSDPSNQQTLLSTLLSYTSMSSPFSSIPKKTSVPKKSAVAKKSTSHRRSNSVASEMKPTFHQKEHQQSSQNFPLWIPDSQQQVKKVVSNVARKSTSKQSKPMLSSYMANTKPNKAKTGNLLQVKFGPGKYLAKAASFANFKKIPVLKTSPLIKKPVSASSKTVAHEVPKAFALSRKTSATSPIPSQTDKKMFPCHERSGDRIACPECSVVVKTYCLRSHLKTVHNLPMKNCKKCKITFTDLNLYSEHYAHHLQEQEDGFSDFQPEESCQTALKKPTSTITRNPSDAASLPNEVPSVSYDTDHYRNLLQTSSSEMKRPSSSFSVGPSPKYRKLTSEVQAAANRITFPKLPPKPRKPSFHPRKKRSFFFAREKSVSESVDSVSQQLEVGRTVLKPKLPAEPRKPFSSFKMKRLCPPSNRDQVFQSKNTMSVSSSERRNSSSLQSEVSCDETFESMRSTSTFYMEKRKMVDGPQSSSEGLPPSKIPRLGNDAAAPVARRYCGKSPHQASLPQQQHSNSELKKTGRPCRNILKATVSLISLETASRPYDCRKCQAAFHLALQCPSSFRLHSQNKPYACPSCPAAFSKPEQLKVHQHSQCDAPPVKMEIEDASFHTSLRRHRLPSTSHSQELVQNVPAKSHGKGGLFECHKCNETFPYRSVLLRHLPYHSYQYSCGVCKKAFVKKVDLLDHLQIMHDGRMLLRCKYCEVKFEDISEFDNHIVTHKDGTVVPCTVCNMTFSNSRQMQIHQTVAHGVSQTPGLVCHVCGKRFNQAKLLSVHLRVNHKTVPGRVCKVCGRRFKQAKHLSAHMKIAHKTSWPIVTKFLSCRYCHKVFHNKQGLGAHYKLRHGVRLEKAMLTKNKRSDSAPDPSSDAPVSTSEATTSQAKSSIPSTSVQKETGIPFTDISSTTCQICGKRYSKRKVLVAHYRHFHQVEPTGKKPEPMKCKICGKVLYSLQGLKVHYKVRHKRRIPKQALPQEDPKPAISVGPNPAVMSDPKPAVTSAPKSATSFSKPAATSVSKAPVTSGSKPPMTSGSKPMSASGNRSRCRCGKCGKFFLHNWSLFRHQRLYHRNSTKGSLKTTPNPESPLCVKVLKNPAPFQKKKQWACHICGKSFVLRKTMRMHIKSEHPHNFADQRYGGRKCHKCGKACGSKAKLHLHLTKCGQTDRAQKKRIWNIVNRFGEFKCTICERMFNWRQNLIRHMQVRHKLSKEVILYNMTHQKLAQAGENYSSRFFLCDVCKLCFTVKRSLNRHLQRGHGGRTGIFQCRRRNCKYAVMKNDAILHHIKTAHPGMSVYWCQGCRLGFDTSGDLFSHRCLSFYSKQSDASASSSQYDENDYVLEDSSSSFPAEQECRYRCMTCDMGFHLAREWTKHMQEHTENVPDISENPLHQEQGLETTDKIRLSIFDVMTGSVFSCKFCRTVFKDESEMNAHICEQPATSNIGSKKGKRKYKSRNLEPVKCTVCLKFFSPLSIKRHMMNIHSMPIRFCGKCRIIFTDFKRYRVHMDCHNQYGGSVEEVEFPASLDDDPNEDSVTLFICQICGGLFSDADSLASHACSGANGEEIAESYHESEVDEHIYTQNEHQILSNETDTTSDSKYSEFLSQSTEIANVYTGHSNGCEKLRESHSVCEDVDEGSFESRIVIESVSGGAAVDLDTSMFGKEVMVNDGKTDTPMTMRNENVSGKQLASCSISSQELMENGFVLAAPSTSESLPFDSGFGESTSGLQEQEQSDINRIPFERLPVSHSTLGNGISDLMENKNAESCEAASLSAYKQAAETGKNIQQEEADTETYNTFHNEQNVDTREFAHCEETEFEAGKTAPCNAGGIETSQKAHSEEASCANVTSNNEYTSLVDSPPDIVVSENQTEDEHCRTLESLHTKQKWEEDYLETQG